MSEAKSSPSQTEDQSVVITRTFDALRSLVFQAWTEPQRVMHWWGPKGFGCPVCKIDLRPGGICLNCMRSPDGRDFWSQGVYRETAGPERDMCRQGWDESLDRRAEYLAKAVP